MEEKRQFQEFRLKYERDLTEALSRVDPQQVQRAKEIIEECKGTIWLIGNGGLASLAEHMAVDLQLAGKRAVALTSVAAVTTWGNDVKFKEIFTEQIKRLANKKDVLIAMSGSGNSGNVLEGIRRFPGQCLVITGCSGGVIGATADLTGFAGIHINFPVNHIGIAQDLTQIILHEICYGMMEGGNCEWRGEIGDVGKSRETYGK